MFRRPFRRNFNRNFNKFNSFNKDRKRINEWIRVPEVRVIGADGSQVGVMPTAQALAMAKEQGLDLIEVSAQAKPPVCRIMDHGKYQYQQEKKARETKGKLTKIEVKGIRLKMKTALNDLKTKAKQAEKFLNKGHKIKVEIVLRGREKAFFNLARQKMIDFMQTLEVETIIEQPIKQSPRGLTMIISKKK